MEFRVAREDFAAHRGQQASAENHAEHVAIIMDGNGRWAKQKGLSRTLGHRKGVESVRNIIKACIERKVKVLTLFAFGIENNKRPMREVRNLFRLFFLGVTKELPFLKSQGIRLSLIGDRRQLPNILQKSVAKAEKDTRGYQNLHLNLAVNYSGRWDILQSVNKLLQSKPAQGEITEAVFDKHMSLSQVVEPQIMIRTGGVKRLSNFLLWDLAYTELFFSKTLWPDFSTAEFLSILDEYAQCERRFGLTGEQVGT